MIYESRPNVGADAAGICLKAGNAVILRGGSESVRSAAAIHAALIAGLRSCPSSTPLLLIRLVGLFWKLLVKNRYAAGPAVIRP